MYVKQKSKTVSVTLMPLVNFLHPTHRLYFTVLKYLK